MPENFRMRMDEKRQDRMRRLLEATGESTQTKAVDVAMKHYLADLEAKQRHIEDLPGEVVDALSTPFIPMERSVTSHVGRVDE